MSLEPQRRQDALSIAAALLNSAADSSASQHHDVDAMEVTVALPGGVDGEVQGLVDASDEMYEEENREDGQDEEDDSEDYDSDESDDGNYPYDAHSDDDSQESGMESEADFGPPAYHSLSEWVADNHYILEGELGDLSGLPNIDPVTFDAAPLVEAGNSMVLDPNPLPNVVPDIMSVPVQPFVPGLTPASNVGPGVASGSVLGVMPAMPGAVPGAAPDVLSDDQSDDTSDAHAGAWELPAFLASNPNPTTIGPSNYGLTDFIGHWGRQNHILQGSPDRYPRLDRLSSLQTKQVASIGYDDLDGDRCDMQGVNWEDLGVTRRAARERRLLTYTNYVNVPGSDRKRPYFPDVELPCSESFFRFRRMNIRRNPLLSHFQLRHLFASTSRSRVFYPTTGNVQEFNPVTGTGGPIIKFSNSPVSQISTLDAAHGVLVAGGFNGEYILRHLDSAAPDDDDTASHGGVITESVSGITNHVSVYRARTSSAPLAAFASNDNRFRVLDLTTQKWLYQQSLPFAPNCTAISPDGRLRVMVGDCTNVVIAAAEPSSSFSSSSSSPSSSIHGDAEPKILHCVPGPRDYGFACAWADDGWTIATAFQDKTVRVWDARRLTGGHDGRGTAVATLRSEMAGVRSLRFSPVGGGRRVLVAAEEADFVSVIDARTWRSKQTVDVFGELGGVAFAEGGRELRVLCCDRTRGGVLQLERCGEGAEFVWDAEREGDAEEERERERERERRRGNRRRDDGEELHLQQQYTPGYAEYDWPRSVFTEQRRFRRGVARRRRMVVENVELEPF